MGGAWGEAIEPQRISKLIEFEQRWRRDPAGRLGPFAGETLTGADVFCLAAHTLAGPAGDLLAAEERLRAASKDALLRVSLDFSGLNLRGAVMSGTDLQGAILGGAQLEDAVLGVAGLRGAFLGGAKLAGAFLDRADLRGAFLNDAHLEHASFHATQLEGAALKGASLADAILTSAVLDGADLRGACLARADLTRASLAGATLSTADLSGAILFEAHLERAVLSGATLARTNLGRASFDATSRLNDARLNRVALYQASFDRTNLAVVSWPAVRCLGDELAASDPREAVVRYNRSGTREVKRGKRKPARRREEEYIAAARAYRSLSVELRAQGVIKDATRFHFRAEVMSRRVSLHRAVRRLRSPLGVIAPLLFLPWLLSLLLSVVAGYGVYHVWRLAVTYAVVVVGFAAAYFLVGQQAHAGLSGVDAVVLSLTSFHGRGLQPGSNLTDAMREIASVEAILGLLIEGLFIAAFTRRITGS